MSSPTTYEIEADQAGDRLDRCLAALFPDQSRSYLQRLISDGHVLLNGQTPRSKSSAINAGDSISIDWPDTSLPDLVPEDFQVPILYEDDDLLVLNKPPGMTVHPGAGTKGGTLVHALLGYSYDDFAAQIDEDQRPGIVHRLDKDTSGAIIVARRAPVRTRLSALFAARKVEKNYLAIVGGRPPANQRIETLIGRHPIHRKRMSVVHSNGKVAISTLRLRDVAENYSLVEVGLETGRTHQIRVHLAHVGIPILGDGTYGKRLANAAPRQMLHAWRLAFRHPMTREQLDITAPPPADFLATCQEYGLSLPDEAAP